MNIAHDPGPTAAPRALIADDERLLREQLRSRLQQVWPELQIVAEARNGREAVELVAQHRPEVVFLDIRMPGLDGVQAAHEILQTDVGEDGWLPEIVFVTAYDEYAVQAFEQGAADYVLKPADPQRLSRTAQRLQERLQQRRLWPTGGEAPASPQLQGLLQQLGAGLHGAKPQHLQWIQAGVGSAVQVIPVDEVLFFVSDEKYTRVQTATQEAFIRKPIKELVGELDPQRFWQIHRSAVVNIGAVTRVERDHRGRQLVSIRGRDEQLEVSRSYAGLFRGM